MTRRETPHADRTRSDADGNAPASNADATDTHVQQACSHQSPDPIPRSQRIALVAMDHLGREAFCYALSACWRMDARLDILTKLPPEEANRMVVRLRGAAATPWRVIRIDDQSGNEILDYAEREHGLLFLASAIDDRAARRLRDGTDSGARHLAVPWVVVEGKSKHG